MPETSFGTQSASLTSPLSAWTQMELITRRGRCRGRMSQPMLRRSPLDAAHCPHHHTPARTAQINLCCHDRLFVPTAKAAAAAACVGMAPARCHGADSRGRRRRRRRRRRLGCRDQGEGLPGGRAWDEHAPLTYRLRRQARGVPPCMHLWRAPAEHRLQPPQLRRDGRQWRAGRCVLRPAALCQAAVPERCEICVGQRMSGSRAA